MNPLRQGLAALVAAGLALGVPAWGEHPRKLVPFASCALVEESGGATVRLRQLYDGAGQPVRFALEYTDTLPASAPGQGASGVRVFLFAAGAPDPATLDEQIEKGALVELRLRPTAPLTRPAMLKIVRAGEDMPELGLGKVVLPAQAEQAGFIAAGDTLANWRAYARSGAYLYWVLVGFNAEYDNIGGGEFAMASIDKAKAAMIGFTARFAGKDLRTVPVAFKPGRTCSE